MIVLFLLAWVISSHFFYLLGVYVWMLALKIEICLERSIRYKRLPKITVGKVCHEAYWYIDIGLFIGSTIGYVILSISIIILFVILLNEGIGHVLNLLKNFEIPRQIKSIFKKLSEIQIG